MYIENVVKNIPQLLQKFRKKFVLFASRKILSLESKNKLDLFCILLAYSYFCAE